MKHGKILLLVGVIWFCAVVGAIYGLEWLDDNNYDMPSVKLSGWQAGVFLVFFAIFMLGWLPMIGVGVWKMFRARHAKYVTESTARI